MLYPLASCSQPLCRFTLSLLLQDQHPSPVVFPTGKPLLFNLFMLLFEQIIKDNKISYCSYADDTQIICCGPAACIWSAETVDSVWLEVADHIFQKLVASCQKLLMLILHYRSEVLTDTRPLQTQMM